MELEDTIPLGFSASMCYRNALISAVRVDKPLITRRKTLHRLPGTGNSLGEVLPEAKTGRLSRKPLRSLDPNSIRLHQLKSSKATSNFVMHGSSSYPSRSTNKQLPSQKKETKKLKVGRFDEHSQKSRKLQIRTYSKSVHNEFNTSDSSLEIHQCDPEVEPLNRILFPCHKTSEFKRNRIQSKDSDCESCLADEAGKSWISEMPGNYQLPSENVLPDLAESNTKVWSLSCDTKNSLSIKKLHDWAIVFHDTDIHIEGNVSDNSLSCVLMRTSPILDAMEGGRIVVTHTGTSYELCGDMLLEAAIEAGVPEWIAEKFIKGFPDDWKDCWKDSERARLKRCVTDSAKHSHKHETIKNSHKSAKLGNSRKMEHQKLDKHYKSSLGKGENHLDGSKSGEGKWKRGSHFPENAEPLSRKKTDKHKHIKVLEITALAAKSEELAEAATPSIRQGNEFTKDTANSSKRIKSRSPSIRTRSGRKVKTQQYFEAPALTNKKKTRTTRKSVKGRRTADIKPKSAKEFVRSNETKSQEQVTESSKSDSISNSTKKSAPKRRELTRKVSQNRRTGKKEISRDVRISNSAKDPTEVPEVKDQESVAMSVIRKRQYHIKIEKLPDDKPYARKYLTRRLSEFEASKIEEVRERVPEKRRSKLDQSVIPKKRSKICEPKMDMKEDPKVKTKTPRSSSKGLKVEKEKSPTKRPTKRKSKSCKTPSQNEKKNVPEKKYKWTQYKKNQLRKFVDQELPWDEIGLHLKFPPDECQAVHADMKPRRKKTKAPIVAEIKGPVKIDAKKGTLKHRAQCRQFINQMNKPNAEKHDLFTGNKDDGFSSDFFSGMINDGNFIPVTPNAKPFDMNFATPAWFKTPSSSGQNTYGYHLTPVLTAKTPVALKSDTPSRVALAGGEKEKRENDRVILQLGKKMMKASMPLNKNSKTQCEKSKSAKSKKVGCSIISKIEKAVKQPEGDDAQSDEDASDAAEEYFDFESE